MANRQNMQPDSALIARLHAACKPSASARAMELGARETGYYLIETPETRIKHTTLGSSINYDPENA